jgi:hypothetical protein
MLVQIELLVNMHALLDFNVLEGSSEDDSNMGYLR